jgi:hypothetical protein
LSAVWPRRSDPAGFFIAPGPTGERTGGKLDISPLSDNLKPPKSSSRK